MCGLEHGSSTQPQFGPHLSPRPWHCLPRAGGRAGRGQGLRGGGRSLWAGDGAKAYGWIPEGRPGCRPCRALVGGQAEPNAPGKRRVTSMVPVFLGCS